MTLRLDAQLLSLLAAWLRWKFNVTAVALRDINLRDADDAMIFAAARAVNAVVVTKDADFRNLLKQQGPPPQVLWLTCGNTPNEKLQLVLGRLLPAALPTIEAR